MRNHEAGQRADDRRVRPAKGRRAVLFVVLLLGLNGLVVGVLYLGTIVWRSASQFDAHSRWGGQAYRSDDRYGIFPLPGQGAFHALEGGEHVPVAFDESGFRVPADDESQLPERPRILFLGGSFTHGYGVPAEQTFASRAAGALGARALNAGGSGWGLSQMVLRAREEIPRHKPDLVVVQYSDWLPERSMRRYGPTYWGKSPAPYFYRDEGIAIQPPVFASINFDVPIREYAGGDWLPFLLHVGIPLYTYDDYHVLRTFVAGQLGLLPEPMESRQEVVDFALGEIQRVAEEHGAKMVLLTIPQDRMDEPDARLEGFSFPVIDTREALAERLPSPSQEAWAQRYYFWRGDPPEIVDRHPSAAMHAALAEILVEALQPATETPQDAWPRRRPRKAPEDPGCEAALNEDCVPAQEKTGHGLG